MRMWRKKKGFTLLEMLVAIVIFAFSVMGSVAMIILMSRTNKSSSRIDQAATLAQSSVEYLTGIDWAILGTDTTTPSDNGLANAEIYTMGPLNFKGQEDDGINEGPFFFYMHGVICTSADSDSASGGPDPCEGAFTGSDRPDDLACDLTGAYSLSASEKLIRLLVAWRDQYGDCKTKALDAIVYD